jgi:hypothetical protein
MNRRLDSWLDEPGQCRPCHGPILAKTKLGMIRDYVCFVTVMWWPLRFFMRGGMQHILPYAGTHAYTCTCWPKVYAANLEQSP